MLQCYNEQTEFRRKYVKLSVYWGWRAAANYTYY